MAQRKRDNDPVSNKIPEAVEIILYLGFRGVCPMLFIVIVDVFQNIAVELLFGAYQGLDAAFKRERQERVRLRHVKIEFLYPLGL
jgi:hypothetical protein